MNALQLTAVLVTLLMLGHAIQTEYFVKPNESTPCPAPQCHTLSHYLENTMRYFTSNTRINFLHGIHRINKSGKLLIKNAFNLTLTGYNVSSSNAAIVCMQPASLKFENMENLVMKHLSILYCGYLILLLDNDAASVAVFFENIVLLTLSNFSVENNTGFGVFGMNVLGNSSISYSRFMFNNYYTLRSTNCSYGQGSCAGGNMYLVYETQPGIISMLSGRPNMISIDSCVFSDGVGITELSSGLGISGNNKFQYKIDVSICNVVSTRNIAQRGANFVFYLRSYIGSIKIINITSFMANYLLPPEKTDSAGFELSATDSIPTSNQTLLHISDSKFYDNNGGGITINLINGYFTVKCQVIIKNCSFHQNQKQTGSGVLLRKLGLLSRISNLNVLVQDSNFTNHIKPEQIFYLTSSFSVVGVYKLRNLTIINCIFAMNQQTALQAFDSTIYFGGHVIFSGNKGAFGGSMLLQGGSMFYLMAHTYIQIDNNHAKRGGGIYVEDDNIATTLPCFFQQLNLQYPQINAVITLVNNTADEAGSAVYGGEIDQCFFYTNNQQIIVLGNTAFMSIFRIISIPSAKSQVSSNPVKVHVCKHNDHFQSGVYPGQLFKIPVVLRGQRNGSVPGIVRSELVNKSRGAHFAPLQETQKTEYSCTNLTYTIFSTSYYELILLGVDGIVFNREKSRILINVTLLPCPPGFQLSSLTAQCECAPLLKDRDLLCNISGAIPLVRRTRSVWISIHPNRNDTILHDNCPLDYCKPIPLWLQLEHSDEQCAYKHSGLLCGKCKSNLSLAIGTSQCLECTNIHLTLLLPFALAGLMLVLFLIVCNLTVSMGTINGLIFYANILRINHAFFFTTPTTSASKIIQQVLAVFVAWLNLDLGIETCFINSMDAYIRTWLQFAFPFYIWMIVGVIIYLSRYSTTIVKLVGSSAVSVLATLFLLSYAKLQRTVITAFSFTYIQNYFEDGKSLAVWLYDGNVPFLQGKHTALFLMALIVTVFFILPFTLLLLFAPCIQASNHFVFKRLKMKLLPLLDAYQAPYKTRFRFWTGLMLVVRSILLIGFSLNILGDPDFNHLLTVTVLSVLLCCIWVTGIVYKNTALSIVEASFILNLLILSGWTIYNRRASNGGSSDGQTALVCTSAGIAFSTFICIMFYHTYLYLKSTKLHLYFKRNKIKRGDQRERGTVEGSVESAVDHPPHHPPTRTVIELREPLLTDN